MIVQFLVALACLLFVVSLPVARTTTGAALRRWACFLFLLAFMPSFFFGILREAVKSLGPWDAERVLGELFAVLFVAAAAYAMLVFWKRRAAHGANAPKRIAMKQTVDPPGARPDLVSMLRDQLRNENDDVE